MSSAAPHRLRCPGRALLKNPSQFTGHCVVVVGGGVWAYDLLDMCFEKRARLVMWVHRALRWIDVPIFFWRSSIRGVAELNAVKVTATVNQHPLNHFLAQHDPVIYLADRWHGTYRRARVGMLGPPVYADPASPANKASNLK